MINPLVEENTRMQSQRMWNGFVTAISNKHIYYPSIKTYDGIRFNHQTNVMTTQRILFVQIEN